MSNQPVVSPSQPSRGFFSPTVSPDFVRKQLKMVIIFMVLGALGSSISSSLYKVAVKEDGHNDPEIAARETLSELDTYCQKAVPGSFSVDKGPANIPASRVRFRLEDGTQIAYYEYKEGFYGERNGESWKAFDGLLCAYFVLPSRLDKNLSVELQVWKQDCLTENCSKPIATIQRYIDTKPVRINRRDTWSCESQIN